MKISLGLHMDEKNQHLLPGKHRTNGDKASRGEKRSEIGTEKNAQHSEEYKWEGDSIAVIDVVVYIKKSIA